MSAVPIAVVQAWPWGPGGHLMGMHWGWWLFWIPVLLVLVWSLARLGSQRTDRSGGPREESAADALRRRFAEGEIDDEEFRRRMDVLRETR